MKEILEKVLDVIKKQQTEDKHFITWDFVKETFIKEIPTATTTPTIKNKVLSDEDFERILHKRLAKIRETLTVKALEYADADANDRLHNFRVAARIDNTTMEKALKGMMLKHEVSVSDMIAKPTQVTEEMIDAKIGDVINYLILLEGIFKERINNV